MTLFCQIITAKSRGFTIPFAKMFAVSTTWTVPLPDFPQSGKVPEYATASPDWYWPPLKFPPEAVKPLKSSVKICASPGVARQRRRTAITAATESRRGLIMMSGSRGSNCRMLGIMNVTLKGCSYQERRDLRCWVRGGETTAFPLISRGDQRASGIHTGQAASRHAFGCHHKVLWFDQA